MSSDRTEEASPRRKQKAKEKGDRVRSRDLLQSAGVLAGALALGTVAAPWASAWKGVMAQSLALTAGPLATHADGAEFALNLRRILLTSLAPFALVLVAIAGATLVASVAQNGGISIHPEALAPKWERLDPGANLKHLVSMRSLVRLAKSLFPVAALFALAWHKWTGQQAVAVMSVVRLPLVFRDSYDLLIDAASLMLLWAGIDYFVEWRSWSKRMRMSKQEMREEFKESEGNPQMRGRIRSLQRQMRRRKIRADVSRASVVITNPTHYAVALSFDFGTMEAPKVLAKGRDLFAEQIKAEARWAGVPVMENPPLARSLYRSVEVGQTIPFQLYAAVAGILAYLYRKDVEDRMRREAAAQRSAAAKGAAAEASVVRPSSAAAEIGSAALLASRPAAAPDSQPLTPSKGDL